ncbi:hypothetical protein [Mycobacterium simiae]|uniref:hypothetical protein n=1 Tax=Mycobacterium simiae TaxID=1784 RepID=UPI00165F3624|nr:hypothetical protein [Mycobacterium simiae]
MTSVGLDDVVGSLNMVLHRGQDGALRGGGYRGGRDALAGGHHRVSADGQRLRCLSGC